MLLLQLLQHHLAIGTLAEQVDQVTIQALQNRRARDDARAAASALPRLDAERDLADMDAAEFARLTRRALSHYGDLPRLAANPLTRLPQIPDVPTLHESGFPGFASISWSGVVAPVGTPALIIEKLNTAINAELTAGEMRETLARLGADVKAGTPADFSAFVADEAPKWAEVIRSSGMKLE